MSENETLSEIDEDCIRVYFSYKSLDERDKRRDAIILKKELMLLYQYAKENPNGQGFASGVDEWISIRGLS